MLRSSSDQNVSSGIAALEKGVALLEAGSLVDAIEAFKVAAASGIAEGWIQLARIEFERENLEVAREYMREAEALAEQGDTSANLSCSLAYQLGYGEGTSQEQEEKSRYFLRRAAELGDPVSQTMLAHQLLWGLNGDIRDEREYEKWIWQAIDQGFDRAIITHVKNLLNLKREIEPRAMQKLQELATRSAQGKKLLQKVIRLHRWSQRSKK